MCRKWNLKKSERIVYFSGIIQKYLTSSEEIVEKFDTRVTATSFVNAKVPESPKSVQPNLVPTPHENVTEESSQMLIGQFTKQGPPQIMPKCEIQHSQHSPIPIDSSMSESSPSHFEEAKVPAVVGLRKVPVKVLKRDIDNKNQN